MLYYVYKGELISFIVYMDIGMDAGDVARLQFSFGQTEVATRIWEIKVSQIECNSIMR